MKLFDDDLAVVKGTQPKTFYLQSSKVHAILGLAVPEGNNLSHSITASFFSINPLKCSTFLTIIYGTTREFQQQREEDSNTDKCIPDKYVG